MGAAKGVAPVNYSQRAWGGLTLTPSLDSPARHSPALLKEKPLGGGGNVAGREQWPRPGGGWGQCIRRAAVPGSPPCLDLPTPVRGCQGLASSHP